MDEPQTAPPATRPHRAGSVYIARVAGIPIYLHFTFLLVLALVALTSDRLDFLVLFVFVFGSVVLHELGHALAAGHFGIQTQDIVLYPIGGLARLRSLGEGLEEFWIAVAGPMVNVAIAAMLAIFMLARGESLAVTQAVGPELSLAKNLLLINLYIFAFNLIPAFPMDGGRILRSLLTLVANKQRATAIAARLGQSIALLFMVYGFYFNFWVAIIGIFVFFAAGQEYAMMRNQTLMRGHLARQAMITHFDVLQHGDTLGHAADLLLASSQQDFPVLHGGEVIGILSRRRLLEGLAARGRAAFLSEFMDREFAHVAPEDDLRKALELVTASGGQPVLVFEGGHLVGYITHENLMEFMVLEATHHPAS